MSPDPSVEPLSTTIASKPGGSRAKHARYRADLVEDRKDDVDHPTEGIHASRRRCSPAAYDSRNSLRALKVMLSVAGTISR